MEQKPGGDIFYDFQIKFYVKIHGRALSHKGFEACTILLKFHENTVLLDVEKLLKVGPGNTKGGNIIVLLTSCLTGSESAVWQLKFFVIICKTD